MSIATARRVKPGSLQRRPLPWHVGDVIQKLRQAQGWTAESMPNVVRQIAFTTAFALSIGLSVGAAQTNNTQWVTAWSTSQQGQGNTSLSDATIRLMARVTASGEAIRIRLDNSYGTRPLVIAAATVGEPMRGAVLSPGSTRAISFDGRIQVTVPVGGSIQSDPIQMPVLSQQDLAVSLHLPEADVRPSQHNGARVTSYFTTDGAGNHTNDETGDAFIGTTTSMFWLKSIDVLSPTSTGTIVAFGDSITDGSCSTNDGHDRWEDWVAVRLHLAAMDGAHKAVINEGIGGNTVTGTVNPPPSSAPGTERLDRDVLSHSGVTHVVLFMGTNDIRRDSTAAQVIEGTEEIIDRAHAAGLKIIGVTIIPRHNRAPTENNSGWTPAKTITRNEVNAWIRHDAPFDGVIDFDRTVQDPENPNRIHAPFNCDGIHPNPRGYYEMGLTVGLELFVD